jgi:hypothetical protein
MHTVPTGRLNIDEDHHDTSKTQAIKIDFYRSYGELPVSYIHDAILLINVRQI